MDSNAPEEFDSKEEFRKPSNDSTNRKYRRRSPVDGSSSSSDGSRERKHSPSPDVSRVTSNVTDKQRKDNGRNQSGRSGESYKHTDRKSSRNYHRQDDHNRRDRNADEYDEGYSKSSYRSGRDTREDLNYPGGDKEHLRNYSRSRFDAAGHLNKDRDSYNRACSSRRLYNMEERNKSRERDRHREDGGERYGKTDQKRNYRDNGSDLTPAHGHEVSRNQQYDSSRRENSDHQKKEGSWRDAKILCSERYGNEEKRRHDDRAAYMEQDNRGLKESSDAMPVIGQDSVAKKSKFSPLESIGPGTTGASEQVYVTDSDIDAAKIAAMKAAELVNKNLVGTGYMSADQKKKLLWGNKKSTASEESANRWDTPTFGDRERQEKFNKLMSLRLHWWPIVGREGRCKGGAEVGQPQSREAAGGASDGTGKAIYCWIAPARWSNCWTWSLKHNLSFPLACNVVLSRRKKLLCNALNLRLVRITVFCPQWYICLTLDTICGLCSNLFGIFCWSISILSLDVPSSLC